MGLRSRLILFMLALLAAMSAVMSALFLHNEKEAAAAAAQGKSAQVLNAMTEVCREASASAEKNTAYSYFKRFLQTPEIIRVSCSRDGRAFLKETYYKPQPSFRPPRLKAFPQPAAGAWEFRNDGGIYILAASRTVMDAKRRVVTARVDFSTRLLANEMDAAVRQSSSLFFAILAVAFALGGAGTLLITRAVADPLRTLAEAARIIGSGKLGHRIPVKGRDEVALLASEFNEMAVRLGELDEMKKDFMSGITHDLRSPVTGIELSADMISALLEKKEYTKIPEQVFTVNEHARRLNGYIDSLLEVSRIESGKSALDIRQVNLEEIADRAVKAHKAYAAQRGLKLELVVAGEITDTRGDPERLYRVVSNLVGNAVKYTPAGSVSVFVESSPGWQKVRVSDTGPGIPAHERAHIFSKFYRISRGGRSYPAARQGTGLGLYISKFIMEQHGGRIEVESSEGKGSDFTALLPTV